MKSKAVIFCNFLVLNDKNERIVVISDSLLFKLQLLRRILTINGSISFRTNKENIYYNNGPNLLSSLYTLPCRGPNFPACIPSHVEDLTYFPASISSHIEDLTYFPACIPSHVEDLTYFPACIPSHEEDLTYFPACIPYHVEDLTYFPACIPSRVDDLTYFPVCIPSHVEDKLSTSLYSLPCTGKTFYQHVYPPMSGSGSG